MYKISSFSLLKALNTLETRGPVYMSKVVVNDA